jgi:cyclic pyranopterin phosphate synthase
MDNSSRVLKTAKVKITTKCNRACDFCIFADGKDGTNMSFELFEAVLDRLSSINFLQLHINGGEPTVHRQFTEISVAARQRLAGRSMVLGTNAITIARNRRLMDVVLENYDEVLIGSDDEHQNFAEVAAVLPTLTAAGKTAVVNSVIEGIDPNRLAWLSDLCSTHGAIHVVNHIHHLDRGQPANQMRGLCLRNRDQHLMIQEDGSCYRCFNAMSRVDSEFNIWDPDFATKLFADRLDHYAFCARCHEYQDSGVMPLGLRKRLSLVDGS